MKPAEVERKWYLLDAAGKSLGHVAAEAAVLLRGKQKLFRQGLSLMTDTRGEMFVIILNAG